MINIPVIFLAAGGSERMGHPKQLLPWGNQTLIEHQINTLLKTEKPVNVVLGAHAEQIIPIIEKFNIEIIINNSWEMGMGTSVNAGIKYVTENCPDSEGVLIALLDQPLITAEYLKKVLDSFQPEKQQIVVSAAQSGWKGAPTIFDKHYFEELKNLDGDKGAKTILQTHPQNVKSVACGKIAEDMDTKEAYEKLLEKFLSTSNR